MDHWNEAYLTEMENLSEDEDTGHDDQGDATAGAFELLSTRKRWGRAA